MAQEEDSTQNFENIFGCACCSDTVKVSFDELNYAQLIKSASKLEGFLDGKLKWTRSISYYNESQVHPDCLMILRAAEEAKDVVIVLILKDENSTHGHRLRLNNGKIVKK